MSPLSQLNFFVSRKKSSECADCGLQPATKEQIRRGPAAWRQCSLPLQPWGSRPHLLSASIVEYEATQVGCPDGSLLVPSQLRAICIWCAPQLAGTILCLSKAGICYEKNYKARISVFSFSATSLCLRLCLPFYSFHVWDSRSEKSPDNCQDSSLFHIQKAQFMISDAPLHSPIQSHNRAWCTSKPVVYEGGAIQS